MTNGWLTSLQYLLCKQEQVAIPVATSSHYQVTFYKPRPLFSSLLEALPGKIWNEREDTHECREASYIIEAETSLLYAKGQMIIHLFKYFLQTRAGLSKEKVSKVCFVF